MFFFLTVVGHFSYFKISLKVTGQTLKYIAYIYNPEKVSFSLWMLPNLPWWIFFLVVLQSRSSHPSNVERLAF